MAVVQKSAIDRLERPTVSVCIANYNGERLLDDCIGSLLAQEGSVVFEVIVHDDASSDSSVELIRKRYPQVELLTSDDNVGFCVSNNRMVAHARGEYVLLLNNDAALFPDALVTFLKWESAQAVSGILTLPQYDWESGGLVDRGCLLDPFYNPVPNLDAERLNVAYVIGACLLIRRSLWTELGGFPESLGSIAEDMYLCLAARLCGYPVQAIPVSGYRHRQGASFGGNRIGQGGLNTSYYRRYLSERNRLAVLISCTPTWLVLPWLSVHFIVLLMEGLILLLLTANPKIWSRIYGRAALDIYNNRDSLVRWRRLTQEKRDVNLGVYLRLFRPVPRKLILLLRHGLPTIRG